jgi:hypothetical protein
MAFVTLPADHDETDFALARRLAGMLNSEEMHVFWIGRDTPEAPLPRIVTASPPPAPAAPPAHGFFAMLGERLAGWLAGPPRRVDAA